MRVDSMRARGLRPRRVRVCLAMSARPVLSSTKLESVGTLKCPWLTPRGANFEAQWPARMYPCRRFALVLTNDDARLGASVVRYSFTVGLLHSFQLTGFDRRTDFLDTAGIGSPVLPEAPDRPFDRAHRSSEPAFFGARKGPFEPPRPAQDGRPEEKASELPPPSRRGPLQADGRRSWIEKVMGRF